MNNNRLSTKKSSASKVDRALLDSNIKKLLEGPSNLEVKEDGRIFIKSLNKYYSDRIKIGLELIDENGGVIRSFASMADCAKYLKVTSMTVAKRLQSCKPGLKKKNEIFFFFTRVDFRSHKTRGGRIYLYWSN